LLTGGASGEGASWAFAEGENTGSVNKSAAANRGIRI
jgi:hypothetical protein